ncbi:hypothetical protein L0Y59_01550, partial [Candidatus Uhrbacteria bacterium]|nr:hypothetical protein [Candidatus Uhrbacteria bacterium]
MAIRKAAPVEGRTRRRARHESEEVIAPALSHRGSNHATRSITSTRDPELSSRFGPANPGVADAKTGLETKEATDRIFDPVE